MLYKFGKKLFSFHSFCMEELESSIHLFYSCTKSNFLWVLFQHFFQIILIIPPIAPLSNIFGFTDHKENYNLINHVLLIFKHYVCKTRENGSLDFKVSKRNINKIKNIGKQISLNKPEKLKRFEQK